MSDGTVWIPWCPACGVEDRGIVAFTYEVASTLLPRLTCRGCGEHVVGLRVREWPI